MKKNLTWIVLGGVLAVGSFAWVKNSTATTKPARQHDARGVDASSADAAAAATSPAVTSSADGGVRRIVSATPFVLERPFTHVWRKEAPSFQAGWLLVLEVDPARVEPRQTAEPVLYAGNQTVERLNHGFESGRVVAILPSERDERGAPALDLARVPFYFGAPALPESVDVDSIRRELAAASARGVRPLSVPSVGETLHLASRDELDPAAALLVLEHSPAETDRALGMLAPRVK